MIEKNQVYRCKHCGNIVEVLHGSGPVIVCCGEPMQLLEAKTQDQGLEKHVPVVERTADGIIVKVGAVEHPMEEAHYIEWIEVITPEKTCRAYLSPGQKPLAHFPINADQLEVREYCTIHGLWRA